jgi:hypothetical protein
VGRVISLATATGGTAEQAAAGGALLACLDRRAGWRPITTRTATPCTPSATPAAGPPNGCAEVLTSTSTAGKSARSAEPAASCK